MKTGLDWKTGSTGHCKARGKLLSYTCSFHGSFLPFLYIADVIAWANNGIMEPSPSCILIMIHQAKGDGDDLIVSTVLALFTFVGIFNFLHDKSLPVVGTGNWGTFYMLLRTSYRATNCVNFQLY